MLRNNILLSGVLKAISLCTSFLIVPITLSYLENESYGIWLTLSSMAYWISAFDIGLGNGMRNYLTEAISQGDMKAGRIYISSTFLLLSVIALLIVLVAGPLIFLLDVSSILNTHCIDNQHLQFVVMVALILTSVNFVVKNIGFIYVAMQKYAVNDLLIVGGNVLALFMVYILTKTTQGNLLYVVAAFMAMPVAIYILGGIPLFIRYPELRPSLKSVDMGFSRGVIKKSLGFFVIQISSCLVIFGGSNLFISHYCGPDSVTTYNIAYKYFNLLTIGYTIIIAPMWNAYTDARVKNDWHWISKTFKRAMLIWVLTVLAGGAMLLGANLFFHLWVGDTVLVPWTVSAAVLAYVTFFNLNNCVTYLLNGLNTILVQIYTSIIATLAYLTFVALCGKSWSIEGFVICMASCYAVMSLVHLYQCRLIINQKATGIWSR